MTIRLMDTSLPGLLPPTYTPFVRCNEPETPGSCYEVVLPDILDAERPFVRQWLWTSKTWRIGQTSDARMLVQLSHQQDQQWTSTALLDETFSEGMIVPWRPRLKEMAQWCISYPYDRVILSNRLAYLGGVVLHASGVRYKDRAWIFGGRSGIGKTTMARLWRDAGAVLMNDDRIAVRWIDGQLWAQATPWHGEDPEVNPDFVPVAGIFHLQQAAQNQVAPLAPTEAVSCLLATAMAPFYCHSSMDALLKTLGEGLLEIPSFRLAFVPGKSVVDVCMHAMD